MEDLLKINAHVYRVLVIHQSYADTENKYYVILFICFFAQGEKKKITTIIKSRTLALCFY